MSRVIMLQTIFYRIPICRYRPNTGISGQISTVSGASLTVCNNLSAMGEALQQGLQEQAAGGDGVLAGDVREVYSREGGEAGPAQGNLVCCEQLHINNDKFQHEAPCMRTAAH